MKSILVLLLLLQQSFITMANTNANVINTQNLEYSNLQVVEMNYDNVDKYYYSFQSKVSGETISAVLTLRSKSELNAIYKPWGTNQAKEGLDVSIELALPKGKIIFENSMLTVITANDMVQQSLNELNNGKVDAHFKKTIQGVVYESDLIEFGKLLNEENLNKGVLACAGASIVLAAAGVTLAAAVAATYASAGAAATAIAAAGRLVGAALIAVDVACIRH